MRRLPATARHLLPPTGDRKRAACEEKIQEIAYRLHPYRYRRSVDGSRQTLSVRDHRPHMF
ncbi:hypothetical protein [Nitrosomonas sp. Nm58]|uniref:hypothetical protein n=1 Tax=Nitrosomonas sp. Nm58 TaxID=200126 RepID=UPI00115FB1FF|nr:hypothetical protein [Nitrosomonas sp. Nm58]